MRLNQLVKLALSILRHPVYTGYALASQRSAKGPDLEVCIRRGADWLLRAQRMAPDGDGYSRRYSLVKGWDRGYIETTGYIIPTLLDVSKLLNDEKYRVSAFLAVEWLLGVQTAEGAFTDIDTHRPQVFDTGQVLLGLNRMFQETGDQRFLDSACKAARWLLDIQENDGSWNHFAYNNRPHSYYSRVAAALIETGLLNGSNEYITAGKRNLDWVVAQERTNGYFKHSEFRPGEDALLHTLAYVIEGFLMAYKLTREHRWAETAIRGTDALKRRVNSNGLLYSQYNEALEPTNKELCITGLAQYAGICFDIYQINQDTDLLHIGKRIMEYFISWQMSHGKDIIGALPSSIPIWGYYGGMEFYNWNVKFFLDGALKWENVKLS